MYLGHFTNLDKSRLGWIWLPMPKTSEKVNNTKKDTPKTAPKKTAADKKPGTAAKKPANVIKKKNQLAKKK